LEQRTDGLLYWFQCLCLTADFDAWKPANHSTRCQSAKKKLPEIGRRNSGCSWQTIIKGYC
jgi:hypothetical protein